MSPAKPKTKTITPEDLRAAARLKAMWNAIPDKPTQQQLADAWPYPDSEANQSLMSQYLNGITALNYRAVLFFASQFGCAPTDIRSDLPELASASGANEPGWDNVMAYAQAAGLGDGIEAAEYAETHKLKFRRDSLRRKRLDPESLAVVYGRGDSMLPRIHSGDAILFDRSDVKPADEALFVILVPGVNAGEYSVKRCRLFGDDVYFDALNPQGDHQWRKPRKMTDPKAPIEIIGRVRWIGSWED